MIKDIKYIIKRIIIGVGIAILLLLIKGTTFMNVNAKTNDNNIYFFTENNVDSPTNYDNLYYTNSCVGCSSTEPLWKPTPVARMVNTERDLETNYAGNRTFFPVVSSYPSINNYKYTLDPMECNPYNTSDCDYNSITEIKIDFNSFLYTPENKEITNFPIKKDKYYSFLLGIQKEDSLNFYGNSDTINLTPDSVNIKIGYSTINGSTPTFSTPSSQNYIDIEEVKWLTHNSIDNGNGNSNQAYIIVKFKIKDSAILEDHDYYLSSLTFDVAPIGGSNNGKNNNSFFIMNTDRNIAGKFYFYTYSFLENGYFEIVSSNNDIVGATPNYDYISSSDLEILDKLEVCEPLDIACHVRNISTMIKSFFVRAGNFFTSIIDFLKKLFIPDFRHLDMYFNNLKTMLQDKFGFLNSSFDLLEYFKDSFLDLEPSTTFSFNGITMPIFNVQIVPAFSFDFSSILENSAINQAYNILYLVLNGLLVLGFVKYCYNSIMDIVGGVSDGIG